MIEILIREFHVTRLECPPEVAHRYVTVPAYVQLLERPAQIPVLRHQLVSHVTENSSHSDRRSVMLLFGECVSMFTIDERLGPFGIIWLLLGITFHELQVVESSVSLEVKSLTKFCLLVCGQGEVHRTHDVQHFFHRYSGISISIDKFKNGFESFPVIDNIFLDLYEEFLGADTLRGHD